jgi:hypothetical protein
MKWVETKDQMGQPAWIPQKLDDLRAKASAAENTVVEKHKSFTAAKRESKNTEELRPLKAARDKAMAARDLLRNQVLETGCSVVEMGGNFYLFRDKTRRTSFHAYVTLKEAQEAATS